MCGICGLVVPSGSPDPALVDAMRAALVHRGPDEGSTDVFGRCALGHQRLRVIDLETGQQPVRSIGAVPLDEPSVVCMDHRPVAFIFPDAAPEPHVHRMGKQDLGFYAIHFLLTQPLLGWTHTNRVKADGEVFLNRAHESSRRHGRAIFNHESFVAIAERHTTRRSCPPLLREVWHPPFRRKI